MAIKTASEEKARSSTIRLHRRPPFSVVLRSRRGRSTRGPSPWVSESPLRLGEAMPFRRLWIDSLQRPGSEFTYGSVTVPISIAPSVRKSPHNVWYRALGLRAEAAQVPCSEEPNADIRILKK